MMRQFRSLPISKPVLAIAALFWVVMLLSILNRHFAMYPSFSSHDQGIFNQVFWNGAHGRWFESSLSSGESAAVLFEQQPPDVAYRRLGQHFTPIHLLWLPIYRVLPFSETLLVLQVTLVALGGLMLYCLARHRLSGQLSLWITLSYFCAQAVIAPNLANFHDFSQIPLFVFALLLAVERQQWVWAIAATILVFLCREDTGIILFSLGLYFAVSRQALRFGVGLCLASVAHLLITTNLLMPLFSSEVGTNFLSTSYSRYVERANPSTVAVLLGLLQRPDRVVLDLVTPFDHTLRFLAGHWLPLLFVPAVSPATWICTAAPLAALLLRTDTSIALSMQLRYTVMIVPGLFYGVILWWSHRSFQLSRPVRRVWAACLCLSLFFTFTLNPSRTWSFLIPDSVTPWVHLSLPQQWQHASEVRSLLAQLSPDTSVSATDNLLPYVSGRRAVLRFPALNFQNDDRLVVKVETILVDFWQLQQYQTAFSDARERLGAWVPLVQTLIAEEQYGLVSATPGVFLLQREKTSNPAALKAWADFLADSRGG
jgi:uncharacterized membrane protein